MACSMRSGISSSRVGSSFIVPRATWPRPGRAANRILRGASSATSLGAFYAAKFALKEPELFRYALSLSGRYDVSWLTDGYNSEAIYLNNPMAYVPNLEGQQLERIRRHTHLVLVCGQGKWEDGNIEDTDAFAKLLAAKGISHQRDLWGHDVSHEWTWWKRQARHHLSAYLPPPPA